tara:strand:+ start:535 stop:1197 length:663 start_codon:yes stop_codon:yes gene_type:complete
MKNHAVIIGNGDPPSASLFLDVMSTLPTLICADGGLRTVLKYGIEPDVVIGDLDSVEISDLDRITNEKIFKVDADNTSTDLQKAIKHAIQLDLEYATLLGFTGGRSDHLLWNLGLLRTFGDVINLRMLDDHGETRLVKGTTTFRAKMGQKVSLTPIDAPVDGIVTRGLRFPLRDESLELGVRDGISNEVVHNPVEITVRCGSLLVFVQRDSLQDAVEWVS